MPLHRRLALLFALQPEDILEVVHRCLPSDMNRNIIFRFMNSTADDFLCKFQEELSYKNEIFGFL